MNCFPVPSKTDVAVAALRVVHRRRHRYLVAVKTASAPAEEFHQLLEALRAVRELPAPRRVLDVVHHLVIVHAADVLDVVDARDVADAPKRARVWGASPTRRRPQSTTRPRGGSRWRRTTPPTASPRLPAHIAYTYSASAVAYSAAGADEVHPVHRAREAVRAEVIPGPRARGRGKTTAPPLGPSDCSNRVRHSRTIKNGARTVGWKISSKSNPLQCVSDVVGRNGVAAAPTPIKLTTASSPYDAFVAASTCFGRLFPSRKSAACVFRRFFIFAATAGMGSSGHIVSGAQCALNASANDVGSDACFV